MSGVPGISTKYVSNRLLSRFLAAINSELMQDGDSVAHCSQHASPKHGNDSQTSLFSFSTFTFKSTGEMMAFNASGFHFPRRSVVCKRRGSMGLRSRSIHLKRCCIYRVYASMVEIEKCVLRWSQHSS